MAPEMLNLDRSTFSKATDIYAYGVLMWEITTQEVPQVRIDPITKTRLWGQLIDTDIHTFPDYVLELLKRCWKEDHRQRPTISAIIDELPEGKFILFVSQCSKKITTKLQYHASDMHGPHRQNPTEKST